MPQYDCLILYVPGFQNRSPALGHGVRTPDRRGVDLARWAGMNPDGEIEL
jgi:hypothetical protein